jgi:hypothetical protein
MKPLQYAPFYLLWITSSVLSVVDWLALRGATIALADAIDRAVPIETQIERQWYLRWAARAADPCSLAFFSVFAFLSIIAFDYLYRTALEKGVIRKRFIQVTAIQVGILVVCGVIILTTTLFVKTA